MTTPFVQLTSGYVGHAGIAVHPGDGTIVHIYQKVVSVNRESLRNVEIWKVVLGQPTPTKPTWTLRHGIDCPGAFGHCDAAFHPSGALIVSVSYDKDASEESDVVGGYWVIPNAGTPWKMASMAMVITKDDVARQSAGQALSEIAAVRASIGSFTATANAAKKAADDAKKSISAATSSLGSQFESGLRQIKDGLAKLDGDIARVSNSVSSAYDLIRGIQANLKPAAQEVLVEAIEYAKTATARTSRLRALIETIMTEKV